MAQILSTNTFTAATWIVNSDATKGTHTTLAGALTSASSGDTILLQSSVTENVTLKAGVNIVALVGSEGTPTISITGKCTMSTAGTVTIAGIRLTTNSDFFLAVTGSGTSIVILEHCYLNALNNTGISFTTSNAAARIQCFYCNGDIGTTGIGLYNSSSTGLILIEYGRYTNSGASTTASTNSAGNVTLAYAEMNSPFSTSSTGNFSTNHALIDTSGTNTVSVTTAGTGTANSHNFSRFVSGSATSLSIGAGTSVTAYMMQIASGNTNAIDGAGTIAYAGIVFTSSSQKINTTTQTGGLLNGGVVQAPSSGFIGEQIRATVANPGNAVSTGTPTTITSITLTAGVWDISLVAVFNGTITGTNFVAAISTVTNSLTAVVGDSEVVTPYAPTANQDNTLVIPAYRVTITTSTTYYYVAQATYTVGSLKCYGRLSATRVG